jgi:4-aminobutyrate aminotransferase-like enzyme
VPARARRAGARITAGLVEAPKVRDVRGLGLLLAVELDREAGPVVAAALERGLVIGSAGPTTLRLTPPLTLSLDEADQALAIISEVAG